MSKKIIKKRKIFILLPEIQEINKRGLRISRLRIIIFASLIILIIMEKLKGQSGGTDPLVLKQAIMIPFSLKIYQQKIVCFH